MDTIWRRSEEKQTYVKPNIAIMKKTLLCWRIFAAVLLLAISTISWANGTKINGIYYVLDSSTKTASVTYTGKTSSNNAYTGSITIPSTVTYNSTTYSVTSIGGSAFSLCRLTSITIPNSVTSIGNYAFYYCSGLTSVTIGNSVTSIGVFAFEGCTGLTSVTIPNSVTSIGESAFRNCSGLTSLKVEEGNPKYDSRNNCNAIIESSTNTLIAGCKTTTIPNSVTSIGSWAFSGCSGLTSVTIPNSVTSIGSSAFSGCSGLTSVTIPNSVTSIGNSAFSSCSGLTSVTIPTSVTRIGNYAFYGCSGLTSVTIPNSVTSIESCAFRNCSGLTSVTIPNSVTSIGGSAFYNCSGLTSITIPNSVTSIGSWAFSGCSGLTSVTIPNSVTSIGDYAFSSCSGLTSVTIPNSVTSIGSYAFSDCSGLKLIVCNNTVPPTALSTSFGSGIIALVPSDAIDNYKKATGWSNLTYNPCFAVSQTTQTTVTLCTPGILTDKQIILDGKTYYPDGETLKITGLSPNKTYTFQTFFKYGDTNYEGSITATTETVELSIKRVERTNLTITVQGSYSAGDAKVTESGFENMTKTDTYKKTGLSPDSKQSFTYYVICSDGSKFTKTAEYSTVPVTVSATASAGASNCRLTGSWDVIDATVTDYGFNGYSKNKSVNVTGLDPNSSYTRTFHVTTKEGSTVSTDVSFTTGNLTISTQLPKVVSAGNVVVAAHSNLDDEETNVGFEWRRTDWTDDFKSNTGVAYLYEGTMEGYIRNLYTEKLWKV